MSPLTQEDQIVIQKVLKAIAVLNWANVMQRWGAKEGRKLMVIAKLSLAAKGSAGITGVFLRTRLKQSDPAFENSHRWSLNQKISPSQQTELIAQALRARYPGRVSSTLGILRGICETPPSPEMIHEAFVTLEETLGIRQGYKEHTVWLEADSTSQLHVLMAANTEEEAQQKAIQEAQAYHQHWMTNQNSVRNIRLKKETSES